MEYCKLIITLIAKLLTHVSYDFCRVFLLVHFFMTNFSLFPFGTANLFRVFVLCQKFSKLLLKAEGKRALLSTHLFTLISLAYFPAFYEGGKSVFRFY